MIILHSEHSEKSRIFVEAYGEGNSVIDWYASSIEQLQYNLSGLPQPSDFPFVVDPVIKKGLVDPESMQWAIDEFAGKHLTEQQKLNRMVVIPKLEIRRAMRSLGIENKLGALLTDETFGKDWRDASEIDLSEELVARALILMEIDADAVKREILKLRKT